MNKLEWKECPKDRDPGVYAGGMRYLINGEIREWKGDSVALESPVCEKVGDALKCRNLGPSAMLSLEEAKKALAAAVKAWNKGCGEWPTMSVAKRIACTEKFLKRMEARRLDVARLICWEVAKPWADSLAEFDRTVAYGRATIQALKELDRTSSRFVVDGGFFSQIRRSPLGVTLCMGPFNYPLNETYTTLLPALIMGNPVIMKPPRAGIFCHFPILEAFAESFPPGVINIITGEGTKIIQPLVETGEIDTLAFIGSAHVANILKKAHPRPNRLRCVLGLGAKNPAVVLADAPMEETVKECVDGALTFNGQRCTALKLLFVQRSIADEFVKRVADAVEGLQHGMPYEDGVVLTPLPGMWAVDKMKQLLDDATSKGARIVNPDGGKTDLTFFHPAVVYPVTDKMELWRKEQFGPIVPIAPFDDPREILDYLVDSPHGQQAAIFGNNPAVIGPLMDAMVNQVCRVNLNSQCRRGPDSFPFGGRKDSAEGTLSISDALRVFSIRSLIAAKYTPENTDLAQRITQGHHSQFLTTDYLF
jgi:acyl-CoA reductase-like NAD-dependent aldehyde dehydrogenase